MTAENRRHTPEETARLGDEIYERVVRPQFDSNNRGKVVAIDVDSETYEVGDDALDASDKLLARQPNAEIWFVRIGFPALYHMGGHSASRNS